MYVLARGGNSKSIRCLTLRILTFSIWICFSLCLPPTVTPFPLSHTNSTMIRFKELPREKKIAVFWFLSALVSVLFPLLMYWGDHAIDGRDDAENGNQEQQQQQYYSMCSWWQFSCKRRERNYYNNYYGQQGQQNQNNQEEDREENSAPWWWFFGSSEEERRQREEQGAASGALIFLYLWSLILFSAGLYYGYRVIMSQQYSLKPLVAGLIVFANMSFVTMILLGGLEGGVQTEGPEVEELGFYAQFAVMLFLTNFLWMVFGIAFAAFLYREHGRREQTLKDQESSSYFPSL